MPYSEIEIERAKAEQAETVAELQTARAVEAEARAKLAERALVLVKAGVPVGEAEQLARKLVKANDVAFAAAVEVTAEHLARLAAGGRCPAGVPAIDKTRAEIIDYMVEQFGLDHDETE